MLKRRVIWLVAVACATGIAGCDFDTPSRAGKSYDPNPPKPPVSQATVELEDQLDRGNAAWEALVAQAQPIEPPPSWTNSPPSDEVFAEWETNNGQRAAKAAEMTREFGKNFSEHPMAEKAPDLELKFLRIAAEHGVTAHEERIRELETLLVGDDPEKLFQYRLDGAMRAAFEKKGQKSNERMVQELERQARRLMEEYPSRMEVYDLLLAVAENCEIRKGMELLREIQASGAAETTKTRAGELLVQGGKALAELDDLEKQRENARAGVKTELADPAAGKPKAAAFATMEELRTAPLGKRMELKFTASDGRKIDLAELKGKVVLIDFWASWCGPCIEELPQLRKAYAKHKEAGFEILGLSLDSKKLPFQRTVGEEKIVWPAAYDEGGWISKLTDNLGIEGIPAMWLVNRNGLISNVTAHEDPTAAIEKAMQAE